MEGKEHSDELNKLLERQDIAFNSAESFKGIISKDEFSSVLTILTKITDKISEGCDLRKEAKNKAIAKFKELEESGVDKEGMAMAVKMIKRELMNTDISMYESFPEEFDNNHNTIDFINRFRAHEDMLDKPNLNWVKKVKQYLNNKKEK